MSFMGNLKHFQTLAPRLLVRGTSQPDSAVTHSGGTWLSPAPCAPREGVVSSLPSYVFLTATLCGRRVLAASADKTNYCTLALLKLFCLLLFPVWVCGEAWKKEAFYAIHAAQTGHGTRGASSGPPSTSGDRAQRLSGPLRSPARLSPARPLSWVHLCALKGPHRSATECGPLLPALHASPAGQESKICQLP